MAKVLWLAIALVVMALAIVAVACEAELDPSLTDLEVGDCVASPELGMIEKLERRTCVPGRDLLRVTKKFEVSGYGSWPGQGTVDSIATVRCPSDTARTLTPTEESWKDAGDREVVCFAYVR